MSKCEPPMATTATQARRLKFATQLRDAFDERNVSIRAAARRLNPDSPETARSNLSRWLRGSHMPSRTSRRQVAVALGFPPDHFEPDSDDEESDQVTDFGRAIDAMFKAAIARAAEEAAARAVARVLGESVAA